MDECPWITQQWVGLVSHRFYCLETSPNDSFRKVHYVLKKKKDIHFFITLDKMEDFSFLFLHSRMSNLFYIVNCKGVLAI